MNSYVSEKLDINYSVPYGLIYMLAGLSNKKQKEVWCELSDIANICAKRLVKKTGQFHSWTAKKFPDTEIELRFDMKKYNNHKVPGVIFQCQIKLGRTKYEEFTQQQVNDYITENILLGSEDE